MGEEDSARRVGALSRYLLDTTVLIRQLRGDSAVSAFLLELVAAEHSLTTSCVNIAELERGLPPKRRRAAKAFLERLGFLDTTREAAVRAGRYQAEFARQGVTIQTPDALVAGTARVHGAIVLTDNLRDFPMRDVRTEAPPAPENGRKTR